MPNLREGYRKAMSNPNIRAAIGGCFFFLILAVIIISVYLVIIIISSSMSGKGTIGAFVKTEWADALEKGDRKMYEKLWDKEARKKNKKHYEKAVKLLDKKLKIDRNQIKTIRDFRNDNQYHVKKIPVTLIDGGTKLLTYRDLIVEKRGWLKIWKITDDEVYFLEEETPPLVKRTDSLTDESNPPPSVDRRLLAKKIVRSKDQFDTSQPDSSDLISGDAPLDTKLKISQVIGEWQVAWQEKDIDKYMSKYADDAIITRVTLRDGKQYPMTLTKSELRQRMEKVKKRNITIEVTISHLQIDGDRVIADVRFRQKFVSTPRGRLPVYSDIGTKTMIFIVDTSRRQEDKSKIYNELTTDGYWKIYEENWRRYVKGRVFPQL